MAAPLPLPAVLSAYTGYQVIAVAVTFGILEITLVSLRFIARRINRSSRGWDDFLVIPGLVANLAQCSLAITMIRIAGVGHHVEEVITRDPEELVLWAKCLLAMEWVYGLAVMLPKLAILGFYLRIFVHRSFRTTVHMLIGIVISTFLATGLTAMFQCIPLRYVWDKTISDGRCIDVLAFYRWISLPNIITDAVMLVLPIPMVWKLNASTGKKFGLTILFLTGSIGFVSSIVRFAIFFRTNAFGDPTWASVSLVIWTTIEPGMYLIAACIPSLRPLLIHIFSGSSGWSRNGQGPRFPDNKLGGSSGKPRGLRAFSKGLGDSGTGSSKEGFTKLVPDIVVDNEEGLELGDRRRDVVPKGKIGVRSDFRVETSPVVGQS